MKKICLSACFNFLVLTAFMCAVSCAASDESVKLSSGVQYRIEENEAVITGGNRYLPEELTKQAE